MIPKQLQEGDFRFVLLKPKEKAPFEKDWTNKGYKFDSERLLEHIKNGGNYGVIGGFGRLRILDIDNQELAREMIKKTNTFTIKTGSQGIHLYFLSDYETNHVLTEKNGELRAKNYQVVGAGSTHPNGNKYEVINDQPIKEVSSESLKTLISPYLRDENPPTPQKKKDTSRSAVEYGKVIKLVWGGKTKKEIFEEMKDSPKWSTSSEQYRELTYSKALAVGSTSKFLNFKRDKNGDLKPYSVNIDKVATHILDIFQIKTIYGKKGEEVFSYEDGIYLPRGREVIQTETERILGAWAKNSVVNEVTNKIKRLTAISREEFDKLPNELLPVKNGILNLLTGEFKDYSPEYYFKTKLRVSFDKEGSCPRWLKFVEQTFYEDDVPVVQEWFGFCLYRDYFVKKGFIGVGEGDTGKSVYQNAILRFFGDENVCGLNLQKIVTDNNFSKATLYNSYVNLYDDMSSKDINEGGGFKMVTGRSPITAEHKFGDEFQFVNFAKMTFCCNKIPTIKETDDLTYYKRWLPIAFDNIVPDEEKDLFLIDKLTTEEELSGILNWAIVGLRRLLKNGKFSYNKTAEQIKEIMDRNSHPLADFCYSVLEKDIDGQITKDDMFQIYMKWSEDNNKQHLSKEKLGRTLPRFAPYLDGGGRTKERYWKFVKVKDDTLDTFYQNLRGYKKSEKTSLNYYSNKSLEKASKVSEEVKKPWELP